VTRPRVLLDGYNLALAKGTGIATYTRNLSRRLGAMGHGVDVLYGLRGPTGARGGLLAEVDFFSETFRRGGTNQMLRRLMTSWRGERAFEVPMDGRVIAKGQADRMPHYDRILNDPEVFPFSRWHHRWYRRFLEVGYERPADLAHWTAPIPMRLKGKPNLYTIHDLVPLRLPHAVGGNHRQFHAIVSDIARKADHIVTVSEASKRDIVDLLKVPEDRVTNTYQGVDLPADLLARSEDEVAAEVSDLFGLEPRGYFLYFGAIEPKKNVGRLIEAYLGSRVAAPLVVAGALAWRDASDLRLLDPAGINETEMLLRLRRGGAEVPKTFDPTLTRFTRSSVMRIEYLPFRLLVSLIRSARAVVFPSIYEGFGLPILEAMMLGTPVITSTEGAVPEVAGDAARLVDPYDVLAIRAAIRDLDADAGLREHLAAAGRVQAARFSNEAYDARLAALYARWT